MYLGVYVCLLLPRTLTLTGVNCAVLTGQKRKADNAAIYAKKDSVEESVCLFSSLETLLDEGDGMK